MDGREGCILVAVLFGEGADTLGGLHSRIQTQLRLRMKASDEPRFSAEMAPDPMLTSRGSSCCQEDGSACGEAMTTDPQNVPAH